MIDVLLTNSDLVIKTSVTDCPFSDHRFISAVLDIKTTKDNSTNIINSRNFSESNLGLIQQAFANIDFAFIDEIVDVNIKWQSLKNLIESVINLICPVKALKLKSNNDQFPWIDLELCVLRNKRDTQHSIFNVSKSPDDYQLFSQFKASYQKLNRQKMYDHFQQKSF